MLLPQRVSECRDVGLDRARPSAEFRLGDALEEESGYSSLNKVKGPASQCERDMTREDWAMKIRS